MAIVNFVIDVLFVFTLVRAYGIGKNNKHLRAELDKKDKQNRIYKALIDYNMKKGTNR